MDTRKLGPMGRLGRYAATHFRVVVAVWVLAAAALGMLAPRVETALSGAGWEASGSQSVEARQLIDDRFGGLGSYALTTVVHSPTRTVGDPAFRKVVANVELALRADDAVDRVVAPAHGASISRDGHTAIVTAGAARTPERMVLAAGELKRELARLGTPAIEVTVRKITDGKKLGLRNPSHISRDSTHRPGVSCQERMPLIQNRLNHEVSE